MGVVGRRFFVCVLWLRELCCYVVTWFRFHVVCGACGVLGASRCFVWVLLLPVCSVPVWRVCLFLCGVRSVAAAWTRFVRVCQLGAFLRHRGCCITLFISGFVVFLTPVKRCLFLAVLRGFLAF